MGILWKCVDPHDVDMKMTTVGFWYRWTTPFMKTNKSPNKDKCSKESLTTSIILLVILLAISLVCNAVLILWWVKWRQQRTRNDTLVRHNPRLRMSVAESSLAARATLRKYERTQEHDLEDHRYSSLRGQNSEDKYEYVDADTDTKLHDPKLDIEEYLTPDDKLPDAPTPPKRRGKPMPLTRRPCVDE